MASKGSRAAAGNIVAILDPSEASTARPKETLADHVLERLDKGQVADPAAYAWKCDQAKPTQAND